jgi:hypothetical protein
MDFALEHVKKDGIAVKSKIRVVSEPNGDAPTLDKRLIKAANQTARDLFGTRDDEKANAIFYQERILPTKSIIEPGALVVIFESFDNLNFVYAKPGGFFQNRNGYFPHDDFIGKPFGSIVRSSNNRGYGFVHLLKPTPEVGCLVCCGRFTKYRLTVVDTFTLLKLWARSLPHRTQIVHELDASMICHYLELRPNMIVCESGTGSGAMSHAIGMWGVIAVSNFAKAPLVSLKSYSFLSTVDCASWETVYF